MISNKQFSNHLSYIRKASGMIAEKLAECTLFGIAQAVQQPTEENPKLRPNMDALIRTRATLKEHAPRSKSRVADFDAYLTTYVVGDILNDDGSISRGPLLTVSKKGKVSAVPGGDFQSFDTAQLYGGDGLTGKYWLMADEQQKPEVDPIEAFRKATAKAVKAGLTVEQLLAAVAEATGAEIGIDEEPAQVQIAA